MAVCGVIVAGVLCLSGLSGDDPPIAGQPINLTFSSGWPIEGVELSGEGWKANVIISADALMELNPLQLNEVCDDKSCIRYHRFCEADVNLACRFVLEGPPGQPLRIEVSAANPQGARAALRSISILRPDGARFPLEDLAIQGRRPSPYCERLGRSNSGPVYEPGCDFLNR